MYDHYVRNESRPCGDARLQPKVESCVTGEVRVRVVMLGDVIFTGNQKITAWKLTKEGEKLLLCIRREPSERRSRSHAHSYAYQLREIKKEGCPTRLALVRIKSISEIEAHKSTSPGTFFEEVKPTWYYDWRKHLHQVSGK